MKFYRSIITALLLLVFSNCLAHEEAVSTLDSVEISLLTCSPHDEVYSLYGHTALRVEDKRTGEDIAINYGMFSFGKPFFVLRFVFGLTDYEMGIEPFDLFCEQYRRYGSSVTQQKINLTPKEKQAIIKALTINYMPENRVYRYNYFYDNCTTRARDIITDNIDGNVSYGPENFSGPSFRELIHSCNEAHPWARFGNDLLLGVGADKCTTRSEYQFIPSNTMNDFDNAYIIDDSGKKRHLVMQKQIVQQAGTQVTKSGFPLRPRTCALILLIITIALTLAEKVMHIRFWGYDTVLMIASGCAGIILFLMLFSQHPTVRLNLQLLLLNPLPLFFVWRMVKRVRDKRPDRQYILWIILICLFMTGGIFQNYAEGMYILASSLLIRNVSGLYKPVNIITKR